MSPRDYGQPWAMQTRKCRFPKSAHGSFRQQHLSNASRLWLARCFHPGPTPAHESVVLEAIR
ncbi:MAG: hypothetical protein ACK4MX_13765, partial [Thermaurantiacus sp.]